MTATRRIDRGETVAVHRKKGRSLVEFTYTSMDCARSGPIQFSLIRGAGLRFVDSPRDFRYLTYMIREWSEGWGKVRWYSGIWFRERGYTYIRTEDADRT